MKRLLRTIAILSMLLMMAGCDGETEEAKTPESIQSEESTVSEESDDLESEVEGVKEEESEAVADIIKQETDSVEEASVIEQVTTTPIIDIKEIPEYTGNAYAVINDNVPYFADNELSTTSYEYYSDLDSLGRCGVCVASIGQDIISTEDRGEIGSVKPSGWQTVKYPGIVEGNYLYNRCHLLGFQLTAENANVNNLITGTRYMNVEGMLPFENMVADYVKETGYHVMYRVTPVFDGDNLVASGVLMEAKSVEDNGNEILFNVFCYNIQPGITIDYASGKSELDGSITAEKEITPADESSTVKQTQKITSEAEPESQPPAVVPANSGAYAVNSKNGKIHITGKCPATGNGSNAMKASVYFGTYEEAEAYSIQITPSQDKRQCGNCW